ncbi:MAG: hypothetical protein KBS62_07730 [Oscillospiraceae bacterium]|nr:hypothetical protein [Candidatus Ruminococcus equi]
MDCFATAQAHFGFKSFLSIAKETTDQKVGCFFWQGQKDTNFKMKFVKLDDPNPLDFGTRLRFLYLQNSPQDCFATAQAHFGFKSFLSIAKETTDQKVGCFFWQGQKDLNPRHAVLERPILLAKHP